MRVEFRKNLEAGALELDHQGPPKQLCIGGSDRSLARAGCLGFVHNFGLGKVCARTSETECRWPAPNV